MVVDGLTLLKLPVTAPIPLLILVVLAFKTVQDKILDWPKVIPAGAAVKLLITGAGGAGKDKVVKVKSGEEVLLLKASREVTLKW